MSIKIVLFKTYPINFSNLAIAQIIENGIEFFYSPCRYLIDDTKFFTCKNGDFANNLGDVRNIDWTHDLSYIDSCLEHGKILIFGHHDNSQINYLKSVYNTNILTIGINYNEDLYQFLLQNLVECHIHRLHTGIIIPNESDKILLATLSKEKLIEHYINLFDSCNFIPRSSFINCDYNIMINDFTNKLKMTNHFNKLGFPFTEKSQQYYDQWLISNSRSN